MNAILHKLWVAREMYYLHNLHPYFLLLNDAAAGIVHPSWFQCKVPNSDVNCNALYCNALNNTENVL